MSINIDLEREAVIQRLIRISIEKPLLPEKFIPWDIKYEQETVCMPEEMTSLYGHPLWETLSPKQQKLLGKQEMVQVVHSYAWSETLACLFFTRHLLTLSSQSSEYRFLLREIIEENRHQEMFSMCVEKMKGEPILPSFWHKVIGEFTVKYCPASWVFMSVLAVELVADEFAHRIRKDKNVYEVLRKCSELHHIEEGRHILYTKLWLEKYTKNANIFQKTGYSLIILLNIYFLRTLYVQKEHFERIGVSDSSIFYKAAKKNYKTIFTENCTQNAIEFVQEINGFNWFTKKVWNFFLKTQIK